MLIKNQIYAIDHHHGQANRTVLSGYPTIRGNTMREKEAYYLKNMSWVHECMCREPRGHNAMLGSILTEAVNEGSAFGVLYLHANGLFDGCGDSTFGTAAAAVETGLVEAVEPVTHLTMDTVMGPLSVEVEIKDGVVKEVRYRNLPAYHIASIEIDIDGRGRTPVDISACGGQYFPQFDAGKLGIDVDKANQAGIKEFGRQVTKALRALPPVNDPETGNSVQMGQNNTNVISLFSKQADEDSYRIANTAAPDFMGRTPGGLPTGALMALLHNREEYAPKNTFRNMSPVGTVFSGTGKPEVLSNGTPALATLVGTKSWLMGIHHFVIDPDDPFPNGFIL